MAKPLPLPVWDRQRGKLVQEWMDDHQPHYESDPQGSFTQWIKSQPLYDRFYALYENSRWSTREIDDRTSSSLDLMPPARVRKLAEMNGSGFDCFNERVWPHRDQCHEFKPAEVFGPGCQRRRPLTSQSEITQVQRRNPSRHPFRQRGAIDHRVHSTFFPIPVAAVARSPRAPI
jgi:hypothetical protein